MCYVQEYIKSEFISCLQASKSVTVDKINRFRNILFNYGWRADHKNDIDKLLSDPDPREIHRFLISNIMSTPLFIERVESKVGSVSVDSIDVEAITIDSESETHYDTGAGPVLDLSESIKKWMVNHVTQNGKYSYRFKDIPYLIPVFVDASNNVPVDVKEMVRFESVNDSVQKIFMWDVHSIILCNGNSKFSALVKDDVDDWYIYSESTIPANKKVNMSDPDTVRMISRQVKAVYYKIK